MINFLDYQKYNYVQNGECASKAELKSLLTSDEKSSEWVKMVANTFKINTERVHIDGSKALIDLLQKISAKKLDRRLCPAELEKIDFVRKSSSASYELSFYINGQRITSIYNAKRAFLDSNFKLSKYADFLLRHDYKNELVDNIEMLRKKEKIADKQKIYRFIQDSDYLYLRAVVSQDRYKFYDNNLALYIALNVLNNLAVKENIWFEVQEATITDSKLWVKFIEKKPYNIGKNVSIRTGVVLTNSELGDGATHFNTYYEIVNRSGKKVSFLREEIANINHGYNPQSIEACFSKLLDFDKVRGDIIKAVKKVQWSNKLTSNDILKLQVLLLHLNRSKKLPKKIKEELIEAINIKQLQKNSITLLDLFDRLENSIDLKDPNIQLILEAKLTNWLHSLVN